MKEKASKILKNDELSVLNVRTELIIIDDLYPMRFGLITIKRAVWIIAIRSRDSETRAEDALAK